MKRLILVIAVLITTLTLSADLVGQIGKWEYGPTEAVAVKDSVAYVSSGSYLWLIDISDETNPSLLEEYKLDNYIYALRVIGNYLYVCKNDSLLLIYDIHNPDSIWLANEISNLSDDAYCDVHAWNDTLYFAYKTGFSKQYSMNDTVNIQFTRFLGQYNQFSRYNTIGAGLHIDYLRTYNLGVSGDIFSHNDSENLGETARGIFIKYPYAYLGNGNSGIRTANISDPYAIILYTPYSTGGYTYDVELIDDSTLAAARGLNGIGIYRIVDDTTFTLLGECQTTGYAFELTLGNDRIYAGCRSGGLSIIDISDLSTPTVLGTYDGYSEVRGFDISGDRLYASGGEGGLSIYDITDRANPVLISKTYSRFIAEDVKVDGNYAYIAEADSGLTIMDISNENAPFIVGSTPISYYARTVDASGDNCACGGNQDDIFGQGIALIDVTNRNTPVEQNQIMDGLTRVDFELRDNTLFCKGNPVGWGHFQIWDISNINSPVFLDSIQSDANWSRFTISDSIVYLTERPNPYVYLYSIKDTTDISYISMDTLFDFSNNIGSVSDYLLTVYTDSIQIWDYNNLLSPNCIYSVDFDEYVPDKIEDDSNNCIYFSVGSEGPGYLDRGKYGLRIYGIDSAGPDAFTIISPVDNDTVSSDSLNILWHSSYSDVGLKRYDIFVNNTKRAETLDTLIELNLGIAGTGRIWIDAIDNLNNTVRSDTVTVNMYSGIEDNHKVQTEPLQITGTFRSISIYNPSDMEQSYSITDITGRIVDNGTLKSNTSYILSPKTGIYYIIDKNTDTAKKMIIIK